MMVFCGVVTKGRWSKLTRVKKKKNSTKRTKNEDKEPKRSGEKKKDNGKEKKEPKRKPQLVTKDEQKELKQFLDTNTGRVEIWYIFSGQFVELDLLIGGH